MSEYLLIKSGRFIKMDLTRWCSSFKYKNGTKDFTDGKIYECYLLPENHRNSGISCYVLDDVGDKRTLFHDEMEGLEVSLSEALIEMSKEDAES